MADEAERQRRPFHSAASRWLREPLLHFLLLGAALFGGYSYFGSRMGGSEAAMQIRLTPDELLQLILVFQAQWQRPPTQAEFSRLVENTYYATTMIEGAAGIKAVDARTRDALNLALLLNVPIFVDQSVYASHEKAGETATPEMKEQFAAMMTDEKTEGRVEIAAALRENMQKK